VSVAPTADLVDEKGSLPLAFSRVRVRGLAAFRIFFLADMLRQAAVHQGGVLLAESLIPRAILNFDSHDLFQTAFREVNWRYWYHVYHLDRNSTQD